MAPFEHVRHLPDIYPQMRLRTVGGTGHHLFLTHTALCLDMFREFLEEDPRRASADKMIGIL